MVLYPRSVQDGKRIVVVTNEILGLVRNGGAATANTFLAFALAKLGHRVHILCTRPGGPAEIDPSWSAEYAKRGVEIARLGPPAQHVVPEKLAVPYAVEQALRADPPDVVIAHDWAGPAYSALRLRQLGLGFGETLFVVYCHGTQVWIYDAHRQIGRRATSFERQAIERASIELADVVVSPSAYLIDWMRDRGWAIPRPTVAPYFTRSAVSGEAASKAPPNGRVNRIAFFGRLEERKGIAPFLEALNGLDPELLAGIELLFVGSETARWSARRVEESLSDAARTRLQDVRFEVDLDQPEAIALLERPGTLAVMPSLVDNSPNVIYECMEHRIPFLASDAGGGPELVAKDDRPRVFVTPTSAGIRGGLERRLSGEEPSVSARPGFDPAETFATWERIVDIAPTSRPVAFDVTGADFVLQLADGDELDPDGLETLMRAQAASNADVVTCATRRSLPTAEEIHIFLGEPRELGLLGNYYGTIGLYRRSLLEGNDDGDWVRLASLSLSGARIVSVPLPLARSQRLPEHMANGSAAALAVVRAFEKASSPELQALPELVAALAAERAASAAAPSLVERLSWIREREGARGLVRRAAAKVSALLRRPSAS
jgi:glycosyltransferase involved in cell wall biosynthesis